MRNNFFARVILMAALLAAATASAAWHFRLPRRWRGDAVEGVSAPAILPEGELRYRARNPETGAVFARYESGLAPGAALDAASAVLVGEGWRPVMTTPSLSIFENSAGRCAVVQALPSPGGASVALLL